MSAERNSVAAALARREQEIENLSEQLAEMRQRLNEKGFEFDCLSIRYEDEMGRKWDGKAFA